MEPLNPSIVNEVLWFQRLAANPKEADLVDAPKEGSVFPLDEDRNLTFGKLFSSGGTSDIFTGTLYQGNNQKLIAVTLKRLTKGEDSRELERERDILNTLRSKGVVNIPNCYGIVNIEGHDFLIEDFIDGELLEHVSYQEGDLEQFLADFKTLARDLDTASAGDEQYIDTDLSLRNIIVSRSGTGRLIISSAEGLINIDKGGTQNVRDFDLNRITFNPFTSHPLSIAGDFLINLENYPTQIKYYTFVTTLFLSLTGYEYPLQRADGLIGQPNIGMLVTSLIKGQILYLNKLYFSPNSQNKKSLLGSILAGVKADERDHLYELQDLFESAIQVVPGRNYPHSLTDFMEKLDKYIRILKK